MKFKLSREHLEAIERDRRVVLNFDAFPAVINLSSIDVEQMKIALFEFIDDERTRIDSVWWSFTEGNDAVWPSKILPFVGHPAYMEWAASGFDPVQALLEESKKRGLETFFSYRVNGSDNGVPGGVSRIPMKEDHPDWLIHTWNENGYWNFAVKGVRDYKLSILREVAQDYDFDGMEIDFARVCPVLPPGQQWVNREALTEFIRSVRSMLLEEERRRGRPFLLSARVPENLLGCHFDGLDVETWARERLVDIFVMGARSFDVDIAAFRRITAGTHIKLYPALDDHHSTDGYQFPPMEVFRGVLSNWWRQGADGVQTFNFAHASAETLHRFGFGNDLWPSAATHLQVYRELADPDSMQRRDKVFVVQRRGGGHGPKVVPNPEDWSTPRFMYFNTNMFAPLPVSLDSTGRADTLLSVYVADDLAAEAKRVDRVTLGVLLSDDTAKNLPDGERLKRVAIATFAHPDQPPDSRRQRYSGPLYNLPPGKGIEDKIELRLNNALLDKATVDRGWLMFKADPGQLAIGDNLVGLRVSERAHDAPGVISIEKLEVHVQYR